MRGTAHDAVVLGRGYVGGGLELEGRRRVTVPLGRRGGKAGTETNVDDLGWCRLQPFGTALGGDERARVGIKCPDVGAEEVVDGMREGVRAGEAGELASGWLFDVDLVSVLPVDGVPALRSGGCEADVKNLKSKREGGIRTRVLAMQLSGSPCYSSPRASTRHICVKHGPASRSGRSYGGG